MKIPHQASGFSAVELLITLFIGFLFVTMGYQLYTVSIQSSGETREQAKAGSFAYEKLRNLEATTIPLLCASTATDSTIDSSKAVMTTTTTCPIASMQNIKLVVVKVKYNVSQKEVAHGMYITR